MEEYQIYQKLARLEATKNRLQIKLTAVDSRISDLQKELEKDAPGIYSTTGVYVIRSANRYKIGYASNVHDRLDQIQTGSPFRCRIVIFIPCEIERAMRLEAHLHIHFSHKRMIGEWFELNQVDLKELLEICKSKHHHDMFQKLFDESEWVEKEPVIIPIKDAYAVLKLIKEISNEEQGLVPVSKVIQRSLSIGMLESETRKILDQIRRDGDVFEPRPGLLKLP